MLPELNALEHFHFLRPGWALLTIPWVAMVLMQRRRHETRDMFGGIIAPNLLEHLRLTRSDSRWLNPRSFTSVFMVLAMILLMGPSWRQQPSPLNQDEAALVVILDVSSSMTQRDVQPSRLQHRESTQVVELAGEQELEDRLGLEESTALDVPQAEVEPELRPPTRSAARRCARPPSRRTPT